MAVIPESQLALLEALAKQMIGQNKGLHMMPFYLSGFLDSLLMGVAISQMFSYWRYIRTDKRYIVVLVFLGFAATTAASISILLWMQQLFVWNFGTYMTFTEFPGLIRYMSLEIVTTIIVQTFYVGRACKLYKHWWPALLIAPFMIGATVIGSVFLHIVVDRYPLISPAVFDDKLVKTLAYIWLSLMLASDLLITAVIAYGLVRLKTGWTHTDSTLKRLVIKCFECQTPALIVATVSLIAWNQQFEVALPFILLQTKVYVLGLLITLNLRSRSEGGTSGVNVSYPSHSASKQSHQIASTPGMYPLLSSSKDHGGVTVETSTHVDQGVHEKDEYGSTTHLYPFARAI